MTGERLEEIRNMINHPDRFAWTSISAGARDLLADRDSLAAELDDWRSGKLRLAPLQTVPAATNTHKEDLRDKFKDPEIVT